MSKIGWILRTITIRKMEEWVRENENTLKTTGKKKKKNLHMFSVAELNAIFYQ